MRVTSRLVRLAVGLSLGCTDAECWQDSDCALVPEPGCYDARCVEDVRAVTLETEARLRVTEVECSQLEHRVCQSPPPPPPSAFCDWPARRCAVLRGSP